MAQLVTPPVATAQFTTPAGFLFPSAVKFLTLIVNALNGTRTPLGATQNTLGNGMTISRGSGSPLGVIGGNVGDLYVNTAGGSGTTLYAKESGIPGDKTGWVGLS